MGPGYDKEDMHLALHSLQEAGPQSFESLRMNVNEAILQHSVLARFWLGWVVTHGSADFKKMMDELEQLGDVEGWDETRLVHAREIVERWYRILDAGSNKLFVRDFIKSLDTVCETLHEGKRAHLVVDLSDANSTQALRAYIEARYREMFREELRIASMTRNGELVLITLAKNVPSLESHAQ